MWMETLSRYWAQSTDSGVLDGAQSYPEKQCRERDGGVVVIGGIISEKRSFKI